MNRRIGDRMSETPDYVGRRSELRDLSRKRAEVGLSAFPSVEEIDQIAAKFNIDKVDAHTYLMNQGGRILAIRDAYD
jgi:hypothetical protein